MMHRLYIVFVPHPRWYKGQKIKRVCKRKPTLKANEVSICIEVTTPEAMFDPVVLPVTVDATKLQRPFEAEAT